MSATHRTIYIYLFVDDTTAVFHQEDTAEWNAVLKELHAKYEIKDMGDAEWLLGMKVRRDRASHQIMLSQEQYIVKAAERYGVQLSSKPPSTPGVDYQEETAAKSPPCDKTLFQQLTGTLIYATISTRPDAAHSVHVLTRHMNDPTEYHLQLAYRVLEYLLATKDQQLMFEGGYMDAPLQIECYADADYASKEGGRYSITGEVLMVNKRPVNWMTKKQSGVALSSTEAELYAQLAGMTELQWIKILFNELQIPFKTPLTLFCDNKSTIHMMKNGTKSERTKHVDVKFTYIKDVLESGVITLEWIKSRENVADIFTKNLPPTTFQSHRVSLLQGNSG
jgi:hypothetical protein